MKRKTRVIIVDPNPHRRTELLHYSLQRKDIRVLGSYSDLGEAILESTAHERPDVLVVNADSVAAQVLRTWAVLRSLVRRDMHVIALTSGERLETLEFLLAVGVAGLHLPDVPPARLLTAIGVVAQGDIDIDATLSDKAKLSHGGQDSCRWNRVGP